MDSKRIQTVYGWLRNLASRPNWTAMPVSAVDITNIKNGLIKISQDIEKEYPFCSQELFNHKDRLFVGWGTIDPRNRPLVIVVGCSFIRRLSKFQKACLMMVIMQMQHSMLLLR